MTNDTASTEANVTVHLGLGSNVGDRRANLREAVARIEKLGVEVARESSIYETEPVGFKDQPWFLNQVIELRIDHDLAFGGAVMAEMKKSAAHLWSWVLELHKALQNIERDMGRERSVPDGPRVIDIDLLLCGELVRTETGDSTTATAGSAYLTIPHPRMHLRRFVLEPLCEIAPDAIHRVFKKTCREMMASLDDPSIVRRYDPTRAHS